MRAKCARLRHMTSLAFVAEHLMRRRHRATAIRRLRSARRIAAEPEQHGGRHRNRENQLQAPERMRALEIIQVDALRERFRRASSPCHLSISTPSQYE